VMRKGLIAALLAIATVPVAAKVLEDAHIRVELSPLNGSIISLLDKRTGTEFIGNPGEARLFQLLMPAPGDYGRRVNSWEQQVENIQIRDQRLEIRWRGLRTAGERTVFGAGQFLVPSENLDIDVRVELEIDDGAFLARLHIDNRSIETVSGVVFPFLGGMQTTAEGSPARIVLPSLGQRVFTNTFGAFGGERTHRYPALLAARWMSFEIGSAGFGIDVASGTDAQDAFFSLSAGRFQGGSAYRGGYAHPLLAWIVWPHLAGQSQWTSPEFRVLVHAGDWRAIAAHHREHRRARSEPRRDPWREDIGFATVSLKREDNTIDRTYDQLAAVAADSGSAGLRRIVVNGWREREGPSNPAPFGERADPRMGGADRLRKVIAELAEEGVELLFSFHPTLMNVFYPTISGATNASYPPPHQDWLVRTRRQATQIPADFRFYTPDYPPELSNTRYRVEIDPASPATDHLLAEARRLRDEYGIRNLFLAGIGQRAFLSYNRDHGVAPQSAYRVGYRRLLGGLRGIFPEGLLLAEGFNDLVNEYSDGGYTWDQRHDTAVLAYSLPWRYFSNDVETLDYEGANESFARKVLINLIVDGGRGTVGRYPEFARHLDALRLLKESTAPYYADAEFRDRDGLTVIAADDWVVVSVFDNVATGQRGIVAANTGKQDTTITVGMEPPVPASRGRLFRLHGSQGEFELSGRTSVTLAPYEVVIIGVDPH
jgi:hypothetical protein